MDRAAWQATHGVTEVRHDLATKQQQPSTTIQGTQMYPSQRENHFLFSCPAHTMGSSALQETVGRNLPSSLMLPSFLDQTGKTGERPEHGACITGSAWTAYTLPSSAG